MSTTLPGLKRALIPCQITARPWLDVDKINCVDFSSNDYLGLRFDPRLISAYQLGIAKYGIGSGASPLVCGYDNVKAEFEVVFADFLNKPAALLFNSGYTANLSVFTTLFPNDSVTFFIDKSCHASIYDALNLRQLTNFEVERFPHLDMSILENKLSQCQSSHKVIVSEGIFSMTGQQAPISQLVALKKKYQGYLVIDDAHCIGLKDHTGRGSLSYTQSANIDIVICPLGKAFAMQGAIVGASQHIIEMLIQSARPYVYSTALGSGLVSGLLETLTIIKQAADLRLKLETNIKMFNQFKLGFSNACYRFLTSNSAIQYLIIGDPIIALKTFDGLKQKGIFCYPMRHPTVPMSQTGLRFVLSAVHTERQIKQLFTVLAECLLN